MLKRTVARNGTVRSLQCRAIALPCKKGKSQLLSNLIKILESIRAPGLNYTFFTEV